MLIERRLHAHGIDYNELPSWQKRGIGLYWVEYEKQGFNPQKNLTETTLRRKVHVDMELPLSKRYTDKIAALL
ncbi:MAG TPA: hypothetical protein DEB24_06205 [Coriobacteriia bacterium]|nr:hypothetical protein [Coriobacteriia bacterium]